MSSHAFPFPPQRTALCVAVALALTHYTSALALPVGQQVVSGQVTVTTPTAQQTVITQGTANAIVNWQQFSIGATERVDIRQPSASSVLLNRVIGNNPSEIYGHLSANGKVFLVNPNGVLFAKGAQVSVGGLVASTLDIANDDFLAGRYQFSGNSGAAVSNLGNIEAASRGTVALLGGRVNNDGTISAQLGTAALAAGEKIVLDFQGDGLTRIRVDQGAVKALVANRGMIVADGGQAIMSASAAQALADTVLNQQGVIRARALVEREGKIVLDGGSHGVTLNSGTLDASGSAGAGGTIHVTGEHVGLTGNAVLDASGDSGGGTILVGGGAHGSNPLLRNAAATFTGPKALLRADARADGKGGTIVLWSDQSTRMYGTASARGAGSGAGGFIETSGHYLDLAGAHVDAGAASGASGTWLLDPYDVDIFDGEVSFPVTGNPNFVSGPEGSELSTATINAALNANTSVTVTTGAGGESLGDIRVNGSIAKTAGNATTSLTLNAANAITVAPGKTITSSAGKLNVDFNADSDSLGGGTILLGNGARIATNGGAVRLYGQSDPEGGFASNVGFDLADGVALSGASIDTTAATGSGGAVTIRGQNLASQGESPVHDRAGVRLSGATITSGGAINITGIGNEASDGVAIEANTVLSSTGSAIDVRGRSGLNDNESTFQGGQGITIDNATLRSGAGTITLTGEAVEDFGLLLGDGAVIGGAGTSGDIALRGYKVHQNSEGLPSTGAMMSLGGTVFTSGWVDVRAARVAVDGTATDAINESVVIQDATTPSYRQGIISTDIGALLNGGNRVSVTSTATDGEANISIEADIVKSSAGNTVLRFDAANDVVLSGAALRAINGKLDIDFNGDADSVNGGRVAMTEGASIATNGGNLRIYGQGDPVAGFATGSALSTTEGVNLSSASIDTTSASAGVAGGAISIRGRGVTIDYSVPGDSFIDSGSGVILDNTELHSGSGAISITGVAADQRDGLSIVGGEILTTGGAVDLRGLALPTLDLGNYFNGVYLEDALISAAGGRLTISGEATNAAGVYIGGATAIGDAASTGDITVRAFSTTTANAPTSMLHLDGTIQTKGVVNLRPGGVTASGALTEKLGEAINIADDTPVGPPPGSPPNPGDVPPGSPDKIPEQFDGATFSLEQGWLSNVVLGGASGVTIGSSTHTGAITVGTDLPFTSVNNVTLQNGGAGSAGITLGSGVNLGTNMLTLSSGGAVTQSGPIIAGALILHGSDAASSFQLTNSGNTVGSLSMRFERAAGTGTGKVDFAHNGNLQLSALEGAGTDGVSGAAQKIDASVAVLAGDVNLQVTGDLSVAQDLITLAGDRTLALNATGSVLMQAGVKLGQASAAGKLNVDVNADADSLGGGAISMDLNSALLTNGGYVRFFGQGDAGVGYASAVDGSQPIGVKLDHASIDTRTSTGASGNILIRGSSDSNGVSGDIARPSAGVRLESSSLTSGNGAIAIGGQGSNGADGVWLSTSSVTSTAGAAIDVRGHVTGSASGTVIEDSVVAANGGGDIVVSGESANGSGVALYGSSTLGGASNSGNIVVRALSTGASAVLPMLQLGGTVRTSGVVNLRPGGVSNKGLLTEANGVAIRVGGVAAPGTFALKQADLGSVIAPQVSTLVLGSAAHTGAIDVTAAGTFGAGYDLTLQNGGAGSAGINLYNGIAIPGRMLTLSSGGSVVQAGPISATSLLVHGTTPLSRFQLTNAGNAVTRFSSHFDVLKGAAPSDGDVNFTTTGSLQVTPLSARGMDGATNTPQAINAAEAVIAGDVVLRAGGDITLRENVSTLGSDITLIAGGHLLNPVGATLTPGGHGRWLVFADTWAGEVDGGLTGTGATRNLYNCAFGGACMSGLPTTGNAFVYAQQPRLDLALTAPAQSFVYGSTNPALGFAANGLVKGDALANALSGSYNTTALPGSDVGNYAVTGTFASALGYLVAAAPGMLAITPATLTYVATPVTRVSGTPNPNLAGSVTGLVNGDTLAAAAGGTLLFTSSAPTAAAPGRYAIDGSGLTARNYQFVQAPANATALLVQAAPVVVPPDVPPPVVVPPVVTPPSLFGLLIGNSPNTGHEVDMASSGLYGRNTANQRGCAGSGPLAGPAGGSGPSDVLATEWSRVRGTPNLSNCIGMTQRYSCGDF